MSKFYVGSLQGQVGKEFFMRGNLNGEQRKSDVYLADKVNMPSQVKGTLAEIRRLFINLRIFVLLLAR